MGFLKDFGSIAGGCFGLIIILFILINIASFIIDYDPSTTIENNTTIELNGVTLTVPQSNNYSINESASLWNFNDTEKFGIGNNISQGNAYQYHDYEYEIDIYVADNNRTAYSDIPDFSELETLEGDSDRTHIEKRTLGDKTIVIYVTEGKDLSKKIVESAHL